jgi:hypothetical protein
MCISFVFYLYIHTIPKVGNNDPLTYFTSDFLSHIISYFVLIWVAYLFSVFNGRGDSLRWPRDTLYQLKWALTLPTSGGRSVSIVRIADWNHGVYFIYLFSCITSVPYDSLNEHSRNKDYPLNGIALLVIEMETSHMTSIKFIWSLGAFSIQGSA